MQTINRRVIIKYTKYKTVNIKKLSITTMIMTNFRFLQIKKGFQEGYRINRSILMINSPIK